MSIDRVLVVIPARDEAALIARCLRSVFDAIEALSMSEHAPEARVIVVLDSCRDATAAAVQAFDGVEMLEIDAANVGVARALGIAYALDTLPEESSAWIANTDADSVVPRQWLIEQLKLADAGADAVIGSVSPVMADLTDDLAAAWRILRTKQSPAGHVHGANLGVRVSSYLDVGGFAAESAHEDVGLVRRLVASGADVRSSLDIDVETSGRKVGRAPGGYASYLHDGELLRKAGGASSS